MGHCHESAEAQLQVTIDRLLPRHNIGESCEATQVIKRQTNHSRFKSFAASIMKECLMDCTPSFGWVLALQGWQPGLGTESQCGAEPD